MADAIGGDAPPFGVEPDDELADLGGGDAAPDGLVDLACKLLEELGMNGYHRGLVAKERQNVDQDNDSNRHCLTLWTEMPTFSNRKKYS